MRNKWNTWDDKVTTNLRSSSLRVAGRGVTRSLSALTERGSRHVSRGSALLRPDLKVLSACLTGGCRSRVSVLREGLRLTGGLVRLYELSWRGDQSVVVTTSSAFTSSSVLSRRRDSSRELDCSLEGPFTSCQEGLVIHWRRLARSLLRQKPHMETSAAPRMM